jgi:hypothetical protein
VDPVSANHHVGADPLTICELHYRLRGVLPESYAPVPRMNCVRGQPVQQHLQQVGAMHPVRLDRVASRPPVRHQPPIRVPKLRIHPARAVPFDVVPETKFAEHAHAIGMECHSGTDLFELGRLFVHMRFEPALPERNRRTNAANSAPDNRDAHRRYTAFAVRVARRR